MRMTATISNMYSFTTEDRWLTMPDGIRLSCTLAVPIPKQSGEKFPVLLEYRPYRKDDSFYNFIQPAIYYLVRRGFIVSYNNECQVNYSSFNTRLLGSQCRYSWYGYIGRKSN